MKVVIDTNILVSGLLSPNSPPGSIARLIATRELCPCYDWRIFHEYDEVLWRPAFGFDRELVEDLLMEIKSNGEVTIGLPLHFPLPDPTDEKFLEVAIAASAHCLITGNIRHFPPVARKGVSVLSPRQFIDMISRKNG